MAENPKGDQSGGVNIISGTINTGGGAIVGRDQNINHGPSRGLEEALRPLAEVINAAPQEKRAEAIAKFDELKKEAAKGEKRDDGVVARLVEGLVDLVPGAVTAVVSAFGTPILGATVGPITKYVLGKLQTE